MKPLTQGFFLAAICALLITGAGCDSGGGTDGIAGDAGSGENGGGGDPGGGTGGGSLPASFPTYASVSLFSAGGIFDQPIPPTPEIDPASSTLIGSILRSGGLVMSVRQYSTTVFFADASTPRHNVKIECGPAWELGVSQMLNVPIPDFAVPQFDTDGASNPPVGCGDASDQDNFMVILDTGSRCEFDFWQARKSNGSWAASWANRISLDGSGVFARGLSSRGSGFAFLGGVIWPDELVSGRIEHALVFNYPFTKAGGPVAPATESDGESTAADAIPEGARLQLDPALDLTGLTLAPYERTIARAMQEFGLLLVDNGGDVGIGLYAIDPGSVQGDPYGGLLPADDFVTLPNIPLNQLRVLKLPPQNADFQAGLGVETNSCAVMQ